MTLRKAYIRYREHLPESEMMYAALEGFRQRGTETAPFYGFGDIEKLDDLGHDVGIVGFIGDVWTALDTLGIERPPSLDYPDELRNFLGRPLELAKLGDVRNRTSAGIFVKPIKQKLFTGFVLTGSFNDAIRLAPYSEDEDVWLSPVVSFVSEYRCFILDGKILDARLYKGDWAKAPDREIVEAAIEAWTSAPVAYTLDFGVTDTGRTLLVEVNDGFSAGHYGLLNVLYAQFCEARWQQLTEPLLAQEGPVLIPGSEPITIGRTGFTAQECYPLPRKQGR